MGNKPIEWAVLCIYSKAASRSLGIIPSRIASLILSFIKPTSREGLNPKSP